MLLTAPASNPVLGLQVRSLDKKASCNKLTQRVRTITTNTATVENADWQVPEESDRVSSEERIEQFRSNVLKLARAGNPGRKIRASRSVRESTRVWKILEAIEKYRLPQGKPVDIGCVEVDGEAYVFAIRTDYREIGPNLVMDIARADEA